jgi:hypothetical protein
MALACTTGPSQLLESEEDGRGAVGVRATQDRASEPALQWLPGQEAPLCAIPGAGGVQVDVGA